MQKIYEVSVEANEPWTSGQCNALMLAVRRYVGTDCNLALDQRDINPADYSDADELLNDSDDDYLGVGGNVHEDADGYCFMNKIAAQNLLSAIADYGNPLGMTVRLYTHEAK